MNNKTLHLAFLFLIIISCAPSPSKLAEIDPNALINHVQSLYTVSDKVHSIVVCSKGPYGFAEGVWAGMPVRTVSPGEYVVVDDYEHDDFAKEALAKTNDELVSERDMVSEYL